MAAAAFTCELERGHDPGSDSDRASVAVLAAGHLVGEITGLLGAFGTIRSGLAN